MEDQHLSKTIDKLEKKGFKDQLKYEDHHLLNLNTKSTYTADQIIACEEFRFEGMTNPSDMSILFAITFDDQTKGTLTAAYGPQGDIDLIQFMNEIST